MTLYIAVILIESTFQAEKLRNAEKENEELKRRLQLEQLKNASRENIFRSLNDKVLSRA